MGLGLATKGVISLGFGGGQIGVEERIVFGETITATVETLTQMTAAVEEVEE